MKRCPLRELHELPWFPRLWRDELTEFLSFFTIYSGVYTPALHRLARIMERADLPETYTDLCSGGGLYEIGFVRRLRALTGRPVRARLTDLYPNAHWPEVRRLAPEAVGCVPESCPAETAIARYPGLHVMFSGLHHFTPEEIASMVKCAAQHDRSLALFDYSRRNFWRELFPMLAAIPLMLLTAFLVWPFSWKRLCFTWLVPVLPLLLWIDGWISRFRAYEAEELERVVRALDLPAACRVETGRLPCCGRLGAVTYLVIECLNLE